MQFNINLFYDFDFIVKQGRVNITRRMKLDILIIKVNRKNTLRKQYFQTVFM